MPYSIYTRTDLEDEGLILIHKNKDREPLEKVIQLAEDPYVGVVPYGPRAGQFCVWIRVSFSPLDHFPYDAPYSRQDSKHAPRMTVKEIADYVSNKVPNTVYLVGGEPMYKWDDEIKYLVQELKDREREVIVETCGVIFPDTLNDSVCDRFVIKPQLFDAVPRDEQGGYMLQHLPNVLRLWKKTIPEDRRHWHFDIDTNCSEEDLNFQIAKITSFMIDLYEEQSFDGVTFVFTPMHSLDGAEGPYQKTKDAVGRFILNYSGATVLIQKHME